MSSHLVSYLHFLYTFDSVNSLEFQFLRFSMYAVGFLPKHAGTRKERLSVSANEATTQIFFVPPHKLCQFLEETSALFGDSR